MELTLILLVFILATYKDIIGLKNFSLTREKDVLYLKIGFGLIGMALLVAGIDRFVQWLELRYKPELFFINDWLLNLPYNDLSVYFRYNSPLIIKAIRGIYLYGFFVPFIFLMLRAVAQRDFRNLSLLFFGTFAFHYAAHFPFYFLTEGHQIWYVKDVMVPLFRTMSPLDHVFPSMHSSMSVTSLLLAWQQPNKWIRALYSVFCPLVIFSTFYLQIHWTIDAVAGALIGVAAVKFAKHATDRGWLYTVMGALGSLFPGRSQHQSLSRG